MRPSDYFKRYKRYYTALTPVLRTKKFKDYTYLILTLFSTAFFAFFAIRPTVKTIINLRRQILDAKESSTKLQDKIKALASGQEKISSLGDDLISLDSALPKKPTVEFIAKQLESLSYASNVNLNYLSFSGLSLRQEGQQISLKPKTNLKEIPLNFLVEGSYKDILDFLDKFNQLSRILILENFQLSKRKMTTQEGKPIEINPGNPNLSLTIRARGYYRE